MYMQLLIMYAAAQRTVEKISLLEEDTASFNSVRTQDKFLQQVVAPVMCKFSRSLFWTWLRSFSKIAQYKMSFKIRRLTSPGHAQLSPY